MLVGRTRTALWLGATAVAYVVAHRVGMMFLDPTARSSTVWPATGVALAALLLTPRARRLPVYLTLAAINFASDMLIGATLLAGLGALATGMLELVLAVWCLERGARSRVDFEKVRDVTGLLCAATLGCALAASFAAGATALSHGVSFWRTHRTWWIADGLGMLTASTLVVAWGRARHDRRPWQWSRVAEQLAFLLVWLGVAWFTFRGEAWLPDFAPGPYILIALLAWPALRMGQRWVTLALALLAATAILSTRTGLWHSPWGGRTLHERLLLLQIYLGFTSGSALLFAASVSERRAAEQASDAAEERSRVDAERLTGALESAGMATWEWQVGTNTTYWSPNVDGLLGCAPGAYARTFDAYIAAVHPDDRATLQQTIQAAIERGDSEYASQHRIVTPDGSERWMESKGHLHVDAQGKPTRLAGTLVDVTQRRRTEQAVVAGDLLLRQCIKYTPAAVAMFDTQMRYLQASDRWLSDYHLEGQSLLGRSHYDVFPDVPEHWKQVHQRVLAGAVERNDDDPFPRADGGTEWLQWEVRPWRKPDGDIGGVVMFTQVVTERKQAEERNRQLQEQLRQAQKLEALGTLAGGIAHDFNNILAAIVAYTQIAQMDNPNNHELQSHLGEVLGASSRAANLVQQILSFSRRQRQERKTQSLTPIVREALKLLRSTLPATIEIREEVASELPDVLADPTQMHQVLMNLCTNASHAMKGRGELKLSMAPYKLDAKATSPHLELRAGHYLRLSVTDNGAGMDEQVMSRIFEPFFTTKLSGEGTGLGLAVVHGIIKEHEGTITVRSGLGRGTTFDVYLPAAAPAQPLVDDALADVALGHRERVLFVDDETALCAVAKQLLERLGYEPHVFQDPEAAWLAFRADPGGFDVVITDLTMPGRTGLDLADDVLRLRPSCPIILCSGYSATLTSTMLGEMGIRELLFKPVDYRSLAAALSRALPRQLSRTA